jgi:hypothetical protein
MPKEKVASTDEERETYLVLKAFTSLPSTLKVAVLSIVLVALAVLAYFKFFHDKVDKAPPIVINNEIHTAPEVVQNPSPPVHGARKPIESAQITVPYTGGKQENRENANNVPQNVEAEHESVEDGLAADFHLKHLPQRGAKGTNNSAG